ncbi:hypothetical protein HDV01_004726 [Terramyces sp. JEL0728]|nr:hypothetical protein HDV01_004726 [Terramyces sp. JEL0728]
MKVYVIGSVNIDDVYLVPHIVRPGETIGSTEFKVYPGGKGANQAIALGKAGAEVHLVACVGKDGLWLLDLYKPFVNTDKVLVIEESTGKAIIQVDQSTHDNAIVLFPGANQKIPANHLNFLAESPGWIVLQNEINTDAANYAIEYGKKNKSIVCLNPAPCPTDIHDLKIELVDILIFNETEAQEFTIQLSGSASTPFENLDVMMARLSAFVVVITLGRNGVVAACRTRNRIAKFTEKVTRKPKLVDTTGAGDTFVGYLIAHLASHLDSSTLDRTHLHIQDALKIATLASGLACETQGAMNSIPLKDQVEILY